ncbi:MAG: site-specific integrase, partial [Fimbriimonadales bacterium]
MHNLNLTVLDTADELTESLQLWLDALQANGASLRTIENYRDCVGAFIRFLQAHGVSTLDKVDPVHIRRWLIDKREQGVSPETLHNA